MFRFRLLALISSAALLTACVTTHGIQYDGAQARQFSPGHATKTQVLAALGKPFATETFTVKKDLGNSPLDTPAVVERVEYYYSSRDSASAVAKNWAHRRTVFDFLDGKLISTRNHSIFAQEFTDFNENAVKQLVKGQTTQDDVRRLLGQPSGRGIYPATKVPGGSTWSYTVQWWDSTIGKRHYKTLTIHFSPENVVIDFDLSISDE